jgi:hypothetical protein
MFEQFWENPFAAPEVAEALVDPTIEDMDQAEEIRREHINRETGIRGIGSLFYLSAFVLILIEIFRVWSSF